MASLSLETGKHVEVTCVMRSNHAAVLQKGFCIQSCDHGTIADWRPLQVLDASQPSPPFDYIVCCPKNIPDAPFPLCHLIAPAVTPGQPVIVLIQNGLNIERPFLAPFPENLVLSGVSCIDAREIAPGVIQHEQPDSLDIGAFPHHSIPVSDQERVAKAFVRMYFAGGKANCRYDANAPLNRWRKLVYNARLNSSCALTGLDTGSLQLDRRSMETLVIASNPVEQRISPSVLVDLRKNMKPFSGRWCAKPQLWV